jgi:hypothetical protein
MAEGMVWLFIVMKLKIIFNFICQGSAPFFAMKGVQIFLPCKEGREDWRAMGVGTSPP